MKTLLLSTAFAVVVSSIALWWRSTKSAEQGPRSLRREDPMSNAGWGGDGYGNSLGHWLSHLWHLGVDVPKACGPYCPAWAPAPSPTPKCDTLAPTTPTCDEECAAKCEAAGVNPANCRCNLVVCNDTLVIKNPSFEHDVSSSDWIESNNGAEHAPDSYWNPDHGSFSIDMNDGYITQDLDTVPGCAYKISFAMSNNPGAQWCQVNQGSQSSSGTETTTIEVSVDGGTPELFNSSTPVDQWDTSATIGNALGSTNATYETKIFEFTASSATTTIKFESETAGVNTGCAGPILDNIQVL